MDKLRVYHDRTGNSLSVWFDDPKKNTFAKKPMMTSCLSRTSVDV